MSANAVHNLWISRQVGPFVVDFYPDQEGEGVTLYIWKNEYRNTGYSVECKNADQVRAVVAEVEAVAA
ncbi:hypothetical protein [Paracoccus sp. SCSIO 75233]|uniref:hypothetical protein n=1 Tax=Paracoccus sp. SCSIO 75233 TaxID=3017782 RepID=UPI0022F0DAA0|nr:hypothetical protein [Paracoccus sp. SCSIO 75233]WBU53510.1 hypothetical protein PAF12_01325 [Paracoccus sp. SCSIO 75233]